MIPNNIKMFGFDSSLSHEMDHNSVCQYFCEDQIYEKEEIMQKPTSALNKEEISTSPIKKNIEDQQYLTVQLYTEGLFKHAIPRSICIIGVHQKSREKYLSCKKGSNLETNDLTINVCNFFKSNFEEFDRFFKFSYEEQQLLENFKKGKQNLEAIRALFGYEFDQRAEDGDFFITRPIVRKKSDMLRRFMIEKIESSGSVRQTLLSRKMNFRNKLALLKYLETVKKGCLHPQKFTSWKNCHFQS